MFRSSQNYFSVFINLFQIDSFASYTDDCTTVKNDATKGGHVEHHHHARMRMLWMCGQCATGYYGLEGGTVHRRPEQFRHH